MDNKNDRTFKFLVRGEEVLYTIFSKQYVKMVIHGGIWPLKYTRIYITDHEGYKKSFSHDIFFWFTSKTEHNEIKEQIYDWLYREKVIEAL